MWLVQWLLLLQGPVRPVTSAGTALNAWKLVSYIALLLLSRCRLCLGLTPSPPIWTAVPRQAIQLTISFAYKA